jgi:hypothetical protein
MDERAAPHVLAACQARSPDVVHVTKAGPADMLKDARWLRFPLS